MTFPEIKLVDAPTATATVLFDFNDLTATPSREVLADEFSIGVPELVGDVDAIDPMYGERLVKIPFRLKGTKPQVAAVQSALARRLLANGQSWLSVRLTQTSRLLFFRTYRAQPQDLSFEYIQTVSATKVETWEVDVVLPCEPFAYGERVTQVAQTINNDPTAATNPMRVVLPSILGDAPTRLRLSYTPSSDALVDTRLMVCVHSKDVVTANVSIPLGSDGGAAAAGSGAATNSDTTAIGGSSWRISFSPTANRSSRLTFSVASLPVGRYRMLARVQTSGAFTGSIDVPSSATAQIATGATSAGWRWVDLGTPSIPSNLPRADDGFATTINASFTLFAARTSASGTLDIDHILLIPVSVIGSAGYRETAREGDGTVSSTQVVVWDGDSESAWVASSSGVVQPSLTSSSGTFTSAIPGAGNSLTLIRRFGPIPPNTPGDVSTASGSLVASYLPRFLYVGDS